MQMADHGLGVEEEYLVENAIEKIGKEYMNKNVEIDSRTASNRLLVLCEDQYHGDLLANTIANSKETIKQ